MNHRDFLSDLPEEIILEVALSLDVPDVLSLKTTSRRLHAIASSDYLWHGLTSGGDLPLRLGISPFISPQTLSASTLQALALRALRLEANWRRKTPRLTGVNPVLYGNHEGSFDEMTFLSGATILLTIRRNRRRERPTVTVSVFSLVDVTNAYKAASFEIPGHLSYFDASVIDDGKTIALAVSVKVNDRVLLEVHCTSLPDISTPARLHNTSHDTPFRVPLQGGGLFHKVSIHGDIVAASIVRVSDEAGANDYEIMVANWRTGYRRTISPHFPLPVMRMDIKLFPSYLVHIAISYDKLILLISFLDDCFEEHALSLGADSSEPILLQDVSCQVFDVSLANCSELYISDSINFGAHNPSSSISLIAFPSFTGPAIGRGKIAQIRLQFSVGQHSRNVAFADVDTLMPFEVPRECYAEHVKLGTTGRRAVWLEQSLGSDNVQLMRLDYDPASKGAPQVNVLLPSEPGLPFKPNYCRALAFDEATGRLCLGLYSGELYILDYA